MTETGAVDWAAALAEIEAEIGKLQATADVIRERLARTGGGGTAPAGGGPGGGGGIRSDAFLGKSIPEAAKALLEAKREKLSTQDVVDGLVKGGLPRSKYNTVYSILSRREKTVGDIVNIKGDWALAAWYPNYRKASKGAKEQNGATTEDKNEAAG